MVGRKRLPFVVLRPAFVPPRAGGWMAPPQFAERLGVPRVT